MNTGIADAVDLGWKLAATLQGWGGDGLLDTYELERRQVLVELLNYQGLDVTGDEPRQFAFPIAAGFDAPEGLDDPGDAGTEVRRAYAERLRGLRAEEFSKPGLDLGYRYERSPICLDDEAEPVRREIGRYTQTSRAGSRAPHAWLRRGFSTLDLFGRGFTLLRFDASVGTEALRRSAAERGVPLRVVDITDAHAREVYERALVLVRPDGFVAWRADRAPEDAAAIIDAIRGA
jgi:hypothetical protein